MIAGKPCVLIADDDPVTLRFLESVVGHCGCEVIAIANAPGALRSLPPGAIHLLLLDRRMPGLDGIALLRALRAAGIHAPAIATSAELDAAAIATLRSAGFDDVLLKPASFATIRTLLGRFLPLDGSVLPDIASRGPDVAELPLLDDALALAAIGGDRDALRALRGLFATELAAIDSDLESGLAPAGVTFGERLHRLRASCGFCGAAQLGATVARFEQELRAGTNSEDAVTAFLRTCRATSVALGAASAGSDVGAPAETAL